MSLNFTGIFIRRLRLLDVDMIPAYNFRERKFNGNPDRKRAAIGCFDTQIEYYLIMTVVGRIVFIGSSAAIVV